MSAALDRTEDEAEQEGGALFQRNAPPPAEASSMLQIVAQGGHSPETVRELLALHREHEASEARKAFHAAMPAVRAEMPTIRRTRKNDQLRSTYADLDSIIETCGPVLARHGFSHSFGYRQTPEAVTAVATITHALGHQESAEATVPAWEGPRSAKGLVLSPGQSTGIAMTYARRYAFGALLGIATSDDADAGAARQVPPAPPPAVMSEKQESEVLELLDEAEGLAPGTKARWRAGYSDGYPASDTPLGLAIPATKHGAIVTKLRERLVELRATDEGEAS